MNSVKPIPRNKNVWAFVLNYLVLPGTGNYLLGYRIQGAIQSLISLVGAVCIILSTKKLLVYPLEAYQKGNVPLEELQSSLLLSLLGLVFLCVGILWVGITHTYILKKTKKYGSS